MCGIWALFGIDCPECDRFGAFMRISHRGPDSWRIESVPHYNNVILAFHRLAVNGPIFGMQPMRLHSFPDVWLCCNGEIYNRDKLGEDHGFEYETDCDVEPIVHLYNKHGIEYCCSQLDGVFAFCLLDTKSQKLFVARDTLGVRPAFKMFTKDGGLGICSEAKGLTSLVIKKGSSDTEISQHKPGTVSIFDVSPEDGKVALVESIRFHTIGQPPKYSTLVPKYGDDVEENIRTLFTAAVKKRMMASRRIGALLSGGLDSSLVAALITKLAKEENLPYKVQTFSIGTPGSPDLMAARKVAEHIDSEHHEILLNEEDLLEQLNNVIYSIEAYDTTTIRASLPMYIISKYIKSKTDTAVLFSGEGADEVAQGYIYFRDAPTPKHSHDESLRLLDDLHYFDVLRCDRTTAAHGLEVRVPFLDHQFVGYYLSLPPDVRYPKNGIEKYLIRKAFNETALLPHDILWREKEAFSDGVSSEKRPLFTVLLENATKKTEGMSLEEAQKLYTTNMPTTPEMFYNRTEFERHYKGRQLFTPYFWMPKWNSGVSDPSARFISHYKGADQN